MAERNWRGRAVIGALAVAVIGLLVFHVRLLTWAGSLLEEEDQPVPAEMIVVLGGDLRGERILRASELAKAGYAPKILVSGAGNVYGLHESDLAVAFAVREGYDERLFTKLKFPAVSTGDELHAVVEELHRLHVHSILLVTSNFHTKRAASILRREDPRIAFHVIGSPDRDFTADGWWKTREGRKTFVLEWSKTTTGWLGW